MSDTNELRPEAWRKAVMEAYGHLWHVNNEPLAPIPLRSPEKAAYEARKCLRELLTHQERGEAINAVGELIGRFTDTAPTAPAAWPQQSTEAWIAETMAGPPPDHPAWEASPQQGEAAEPVDMVLHCPACGKQHIDAPEEHWNREFLYSWENPPHRSHLCHGCGHVWRPADVPTNGVASVKTKGKNDSPTPAVERGVTEARGPKCGVHGICPDAMQCEIEGRCVAALTATGAAQGDATPGKSKDWCDGWNAALMEAQRCSTSQQEAPAAQPMRLCPVCKAAYSGCERCGGVGLVAAEDSAHGIQPAATKGTRA